MMGGDLMDRITVAAAADDDGAVSFPRAERVGVLFQTAKALEYCHFVGLLHR